MRLITKGMLPRLAVIALTSAVAAPASAIDWTALERTHESRLRNIPGESGNPLVGAAERAASRGTRDSSGSAAGKVPAESPRVVPQLQTKLDRSALFSLLRLLR